jgi:undecaprenyl-diphosphatase
LRPSAPDRPSWRTSDLWSIAVRVAIAFCVALGCVVVAALVLEWRWKADGGTGPDREIARWLAARTTATRTDVMRYVTWLGSSNVVVPIAALVVAGLLICRKTWLGVFVAVAVAGNGLLVLIAKNFGADQRPRLGPFGSSFPSGHAAQSATICLALVVVTTFLTRSWVLRVVVCALAVVVCVLVGTSRVYLGYHWASDVFGAWWLAAVWVGGLTVALRRQLAPTAPLRRRQPGPAPRHDREAVVDQ